jgi:hypothetical protein
MAHRCTTQIDRLAAPAESGQALIWPNESLDTLAERNRAALSSCSATIGGRTISQWRSDFLGDESRIMTGHQPAFFHPGVWAKNIAAATCKGQAVFLMVDSDQSGGISLNWPVVRHGACSEGQTSALPAASPLSFEQLPPLTTDSAQKLWQSLPEALRKTPFVSVFQCAYIDSTENDHVSRWKNAMMATEVDLGITGIQYERLSDDFSFARRKSDPSASFVAEVLLNAERFADCYNTALRTYRQRRDIPGHDHPIPNLSLTKAWIEVPFWLLGASSPRRRMFVLASSAERIHIRSGDEQVGEIAVSELRKNPVRCLRETLSEWRIRPRALATTMYSRLLACDLFIHGIGGAKYDQITDDIMRSYFGIEPPVYSCVTATLRLALPHSGFDSLALANLHHRRRDLRFNPQRFSEHIVSPEALVRREAAIAESERLRNHEPSAHSKRRATYEEILKANALVLQDPEAISEDLSKTLEVLQAQAASDRVANGREWFWCMHDRDALTRLIAAVRSRSPLAANRPDAP